MLVIAIKWLVYLCVMLHCFAYAQTSRTTFKHLNCALRRKTQNRNNETFQLLCQSYIFNFCEVLELLPEFS